MAIGGTNRPAGAADQVLQGRVERVTFHSESTLYAVLQVLPEPGYRDPEPAGMFQERLLTAVGTLPEASEGLRLRLFGSWKTHKTHGRQFEFEGFERLEPLDAKGLELYLASKTFAGIGEKLAGRIVGELGVDALDKIRDDPAVLARIPGLKRNVRENLVATLAREGASHRLHAFLRGVGLGPAQAAAVVRNLGPGCEAELRADPYRLAGNVPGIGFAIADRVAHELGIERDAPVRCRAGLVYALDRAASEGHAYVPQAALLASADALLGGVAAERLTAELDGLARTETVVVEAFPGETEPPESNVYLPWLAASERGLAASVARLAGAKVRSLSDERRLARLEEESKLALHPLQRAAVLGLLSQPLGLLTGGPGVGKTTIVRLVVALAEAAGATVALASPTGRAAKRLSEATGHSASTIHRLLGWDVARRRFLHDGERPLACDLLVVDEISMLDCVLAHHLLKAVQAPTRLILLGDPDQLPSVGPGNVLRDLIDSQCLPVHRLTHIFRQQGGSLIVENAHKILAGEFPALPERGDTQADFFLFPAEDPAECARIAVEVTTERIPKRFGLDWLADVQVLVPMYKGECGVDELNRRLREAAGFAGQEVRIGHSTWRTGDRVIQTRNDYEKGVFNGDMGRIARLDAEGALVRYPEQEVHYEPEELSELSPAFAITVHRAQGSEYPAVVIPLVPQHYMMLQRNLLYTAVTRARRLVVLVGSKRAIRAAIDNAEQSLRRSALAGRIRAALKELT